MYRMSYSNQACHWLKSFTALSPQRQVDVMKVIHFVGAGVALGYMHDKSFISLGGTINLLAIVSTLSSSQSLWPTVALR